MLIIKEFSSTLKMRLEDWHTHNELCKHADGTIKDYIEKALGKGLKTIGISDHFPYNFYNNIERIPYEKYSMTLEEIKLYLSTLEDLKIQFQDKINIKSGFEVDYILNQVNKLNKYLEKFIEKLDYILGSLHILYTKKGALCIDDRKFLKDLDIYESYNNVYLHYFDSLIKMIKDKDFELDIISHLDLPKKYNVIPEDKELILNKTIEVLEKIKERDIVIEINTGGFRKDIKEQYPSKEILEKMYELDIPIILGSDAHNPSQIAFNFDYVIRELKKIGYTQLAHFSKRNRNYVKI